MWTQLHNEQLFNQLTTDKRVLHEDTSLNSHNVVETRIKQQKTLV